MINHNTNAHGQFIIFVSGCTSELTKTRLPKLLCVDQDSITAPVLKLLPKEYLDTTSDNPTALNVQFRRELELLSRSLFLDGKIFQILVYVDTDHVPVLVRDMIQQEVISICTALRANTPNKQLVLYEI